MKYAGRIGATCITTRVRYAVIMETVYYAHEDAVACAIFQLAGTDRLHANDRTLN